MKDLLDQVLAEIRSAARFRWYGLLVAWVGCLAGWGWAASQPNIYQAAARIFVDTSSELVPVLGGRIIPPNLDEQIAYVREALLGREQLAAVARDNGLDASAQSPAELEALYTALGGAIEIRSAGRTRNTPDNVYNISYRNSSREKAIGVVTSVVENFVESTLGSSQRQRDTAERFLDERVAEYEARLAQAEQALADFKRDHADRLPGTEGGYFARMQMEREALEQRVRELRVLESKRQRLQDQLDGSDSVVPSMEAADAEPPPNSLDARIQDYESRLDSMLLEYTERHPDVIALRGALDRLLEQRAEQLAALGVENSGQELRALATNPIYQTLQVAIAETDIEIAALRADIEDRQSRVADLQDLVEEVPQVEAELARLNRDYEVIYEQYLALVRSRETQDLTRKAGDTDRVDFRVINPPNASFVPVAPNRPLLLAIVFVGALAAGAGTCYVLAQLSPVFVSRRALTSRTGLPVLGVVTHAWPERRAAAQRWVLFTFGAGIGLLLCVFGALMWIEQYGPGLFNLISSRLS